MPRPPPDPTVEDETVEVELEKLWFWERPYYWDYIGIDVASVPRWQRNWHLTRWAAEKLVHGMEFVGEVLAETIGLNTSNYQWVIDTAEEDDRRRRRRAELDSSREELVQDLRELKAGQLQDQAEAGNNGGSDVDDSAVEGES